MQGEGLKRLTCMVRDKELDYQSPGKTPEPPSAPRAGEVKPTEIRARESRAQTGDRQAGERFSRPRRDAD